MLRANLYRRVIAIALGASMFVALGVGIFGEIYFKRTLEAERERCFTDLGNRIIFMNRMLELPEERMLAMGRTALADIAARWGGGSGFAALSPDAIAVDARRLGVDEIYVINGSNVVVASSFKPDLGLNLAGFNSRFTSFLDSLRGKGKFVGQRISVSTQTGVLNTYQYYSPPGSEYIFEVSCRLDTAFAGAYNGLGYGEFIRLNFSPYLEKGKAGAAVAFDVINYSGQGSWSLIRPGTKRSIDPSIVREAFRDGESLRRAGEKGFYYRPVSTDQAGSGFADRTVAEIEIDTSPLTEFILLTLFTALASCALAGILALFAVRRFFDRSFVRRIESLQAAMEKVAAGERGVSFDSEGQDELASIGKSIESMLQEVGAAEEKLRNAKMAEAVGIMAGGLAHDINNILAGAVGTASLIRNRLDDEGQIPTEELRSSLQLIERTGERGEILVRDLLALARVDRPAPVLVDLSALVQDTVGLLRASTPASVSLEFEGPKGTALVLGSAEDLRRAILNLCRNGIQAMTDMRSPEEKRGGRLSLSIEKSRGVWILAVCDTGVGISPEILPRLFTPFFSTKSHRGGSGLGLAASKAIVEAHGGRIEVDSKEGLGSTFKLILPSAAEEASAGQAGSPKAESKTTSIHPLAH